MRISPFRSIGVVVLLAACNVDVNTSVTAAGSTTDNGTTAGTTTSDTTTTTTTSATTGPTSGMSGTATSEPGTTEPGTTEPGTTEPGTTEPGTSEPGTTEPGTTEPETSGTTGEPESTGAPGESTGEPVVCADLGPQQCMANRACMAIFGQKINTQKMCLQKPSFLECADAAGCGDALTIGCPMGTMEQYQFPDTCLPADFEPCDGMVLDQAC